MTRLLDGLVRLRTFRQTRQRTFFRFFPTACLSLLFGLLGGSLVGTFLDLPRAAGWWDGALILAMVLASELRTLAHYTRVPRPLPLHFLKMGALFSFFVDAFKVGSLLHSKFGKRGIRTLANRSTIRPVFETGAFNRSAIFPLAS